MVVPLLRSGYAEDGQEGSEVRVDAMLTKCMRDHQREGLQFLFDCVTGQKTENGQGWCGAFCCLYAYSM